MSITQYCRSPLVFSRTDKPFKVIKVLEVKCENLQEALCILHGGCERMKTVLCVSGCPLSSVRHDVAKIVADSRYMDIYFSLVGQLCRL